MKFLWLLIKKSFRKLNSEKSLAMTANCDKNFIVLKYTDFATQNGLISTDLCLNILRTQSTALGTMMRGRAERKFKVIL